MIGGGGMAPWPPLDPPLICTSCQNNLGLEIHVDAAFLRIFAKVIWQRYFDYKIN